VVIAGGHRRAKRTGRLALMLGGIMLATLIILPPLFIVPGNPPAKV
jgi:hypothetical protein